MTLSARAPSPAAAQALRCLSERTPSGLPPPPGQQSQQCPWQGSRRWSSDAPEREQSWGWPCCGQASPEGPTAFVTEETWP